MAVSQTRYALREAADVKMDTKKPMMGGPVVRGTSSTLFHDFLFSVFLKYF